MNSPAFGCFDDSSSLSIVKAAIWIFSSNRICSIMDAKGTLFVLIVSLAMGLETSHGAMPFGRLMSLHYAPDDIRTVVVPQTNNRLWPSLPKDDLGTSRLSVALAARS
jgi:hypothetical protein